MKPGQIEIEKLRPPAASVAGFAFPQRKTTRAGRKRKDCDRKPSGKPRYAETDYGPAYGAMQRLAKTSPSAAIDALQSLTELGRLTGRNFDDLPKEEQADIRRRLRAADDEARALAKRKSDKRASYPLGILYAKGLISGQSHYAGRRYAALFVAAVRSVGVPSILADLVGRGAVSFYRGDALASPQQLQRLADLEIDYRRAREAITAEGIRVVRIVDEVVVYEEGQPVGGTPRLRMLETGLRALAARFEIMDAARRAKE